MVGSLQFDRAAPVNLVFGAAVTSIVERRQGRAGASLRSSRASGYTQGVQFEWDQAKASSNDAKHGVAFTEAATVFGDPLSLVFADPDHSWDEQRSLIIGRSERSRVLIVAYTERGEAIRIISAREVTRREREQYENG